MQNQKFRVVIAGGGTAGWLTAAALTIQMGNAINIQLVESDEISTVGVGEATIPPIKTFHRLLRIDEQQFMRATHATFKLGIQFENWKSLGSNYFHSFGTTGKETLITEFIHFWMRAKELGISNHFSDYCLELQAALNNKCSTDKEHALNYAFHLDAGHYASFLRGLAENAGVVRTEGKIKSVIQHTDTGNITGLILDSEQDVKGDFFIDCTGFRALLIEKTLHAGFEDWSHWLPCDSAIAVQTKSTQPAIPYTRSIAHDAGWRWQIPLQHRIGNGLVFSSNHLSKDDAHNQLKQSLDGDLLSDPKYISFKTGKRRKAWVKNCVAIGLSAGFIEPLESTSIHLIMTAITRLLQLFPQKEIKQSVIDEYNSQVDTEIENIRDFIILHYKLTERTDSGFWRYCKNMEIPPKLAHRISLFKEAGKSYQTEGELFRLDSWTQVMLGQGLFPEQHHPIVNTMNKSELEMFLKSLESRIAFVIDKLPSHQDLLKQYCSIE